VKKQIDKEIFSFKDLLGACFHQLTIGDERISLLAKNPLGFALSFSASKSWN
jgi:hypothetical protein